MRTCDLAIIGSGPGGYVAALYAARHGMSVSLIEKDLVGGTCLNRGCIPTKVMLNSAQILHAVKGASLHGIDVKAFELNFGKVISRKNEVVSRLRAGIEALFRANRIDVVKGAAEFADPQTLKVDNTAEIRAKSVIIAAGSRPAALAGVEFDEDRILSSNGILDVAKVPESIVIIGGGVIGCEFATLFNSIGAKVAIVELMERLLPSQSREASKKLELIFRKNGVDVFTSAKVEAVRGGMQAEVTISGGRVLKAERVLVSVGRVPDSAGLGLERIGIETRNGRVVVDEYMRTAVKGVYAVGDCVGGALMAHKASYEGLLACDNIAGRARKADYSNVPSCIFTEPEIASVGLSEEEAKALYPDARTAKFPYLASGKASLLGRTEGYIKMTGDTAGKILGVEIFGAGACDLIGEATLARTAGVNVKELCRVVHGHPTLSEIFQEAAHIFCGTAIHSL